MNDIDDVKFSPDISGLKSYLELIKKCQAGNHHSKDTSRYFGIEHFVLENAEHFDKIGDKDKYNILHTTPRECFKNAYQAMVINYDLIYVEGFAMYKEILFPTLHAWCINQDGEIIDPTYQHPEKVVYYGIKFNEEYILNTIIKREKYGIIDNPEQRFPLLNKNETSFKYPIHETV